MQVTEVDVAFVKPKDGLIAFDSVVLDDQLYLSGIAIHSRLVGSGYRLTYPTRKVGEEGAAVWRDTSPGNVINATAAGAYPIGVAVQAAGTDQTTCHVRLSGIPMMAAST